MNVIEGVSVISIGEAKGHGIYVDEQTLLEVKDCAESYRGGVKVNLDHGAGIRDIVGYCTNFRIEEDKLLADLNLLESSHMKEYVLEISTKLPDTFGISISFSGPTREINGMYFASCEELYSADLVQTPAANATGLFSFTSKQVDNFIKDMAETTEAPDKTDKEEGVTIVELAKRMDALEETMLTYKTQMEALMPPTDLKDCVDEMSINEKLEAKLDRIISNFGALPAKASVAVDNVPQPIFSLKKVILEKTKELGSRIAATKFAIANHPTEYIAARDNNQLNF